MGKERIILVTGLTGAGKTTYCTKLEKNKVGFAFSIDQWMTALFWQDMPKNPKMNWFVENQAWYLERIERCESFITKEIIKNCSLGLISILDLGFSKAKHRQKYIELARDINAGVEIHYLKVPSDTRWSRVEQRNQERGETYSMHVDSDMFKFMEETFEDFTQNELNCLKKINKLRINSKRSLLDKNPHRT